MTSQRSCGKIAATRSHALDALTFDLSPLNTGGYATR
jgi:hypothetical protein